MSIPGPPPPSLAEAERALAVWLRYALRHRPSYVESVVGGRYDVDVDLPGDALACVRRGRRDPEVDERYLEPMCALRDGDLELPYRVTDAYLTIHDLYESVGSGRAAPVAPRDDDATWYETVFAVHSVRLRMRLEAAHRRGEHDPGNEPRSAIPADPRADPTPEQIVDAALRHRPIAL